MSVQARVVKELGNYVCEVSDSEGGRAGGVGGLGKKGGPRVEKELGNFVC